MIRHYILGTPAATPAVPCAPPLSPLPPDPPLAVSQEGRAAVLTLPLQPRDQVFGLGEQVRGMNKRGHLYRSFNVDHFPHTEDVRSLYCAHNFLLILPERGECLGIFADSAGEVLFDIGFTEHDRLSVRAAFGMHLYILREEDPRTLCRSFRALIGQSYIPPLFGLGYIQSRWGYASDTAVRTIVREHRERHIPLDGVCLDIDYMDHFASFTWNPDAFPDPAGLNRDMKALHVRLIPIMDAGISLEQTPEIAEEGVKRGYMITTESGAPFEGAVWPGLCLFTDFLQPPARSWFGSLYRKLLEAGFEGFWNDMNEPSVFYTDAGLQEAYEITDRYRNTRPCLEDTWKLLNAFSSLMGREKDLEGLRQKDGEREVSHLEVHNLYGTGMVMATQEGFHQYDPNRRFLLFARSGSIGSHRYGGLWQGDNASWWSHLLLNLKMMPALNMCGYLYCGADVGGFSCDTTEDLLLRWLGLAIFTPLMRNHSSLNTRDQEIYRFPAWEKMRSLLTVRYALIPYLYSLLVDCALNHDLMFRPLAFDYPGDPLARRCEDQVMLGEGMLAPVVEQNAEGRYVYLPEDMLCLRFRSDTDLDRIPMKRGLHDLSLKTEEAVLFLKKNTVLPLALPGAESTDQLVMTAFRLEGWVEEEASFRLFTDDGLSLPLQGVWHGIRVFSAPCGFRAESDLHLDLSHLISGEVKA